ncbi:MAG TPA: hypothetical protein VMI54_16290 [Polyangiaceae bacterium]|nr:hypothetical protein [Polyangiaceae bacterium]
MSADQKEALTLQALGLLHEQVQARVVHYKGEMETNAELDAITAQVVAQIKAMQAAATAAAGSRQSADEMEAQHVRSMSLLLHKVFSSESQFTSRILKPLGRRVAKLFFESELHEKSKGDKDKTIHHAEQGVYYLLARYKNRLRAELEGFEYASAEVRQGSVDLLAKTERDLQVAFLSRRSPELNRVMTVYAAVVSEFLRDYLPPRLETMAKNTIRAAQTARRENSVGYKVLADAFPAFREQWERVFMEQMVNFSGDELVLRLTQSGSDFHDETLRFFSDPHVYSESAEVVCHELYDFLCLEGFLDLPASFGTEGPRA